MSQANIAYASFLSSYALWVWTRSFVRQRPVIHKPMDFNEGKWWIWH